jgi:hypothetical protein
MPGEPTDAEVIRAALEAKLLELHTSLPARVKSYNSALQTVDAVPVIKRAIRRRDGSVAHESLPVIHNVPVMWHEGGGFSMQLPLSAGDHVWLIFSEAATAQWRATGQVSEPGDLRRHDLSYAAAIPAGHPVAGSLLPPPPGHAMITTPSDFHFGNPLLSQYVALANLVNAALTALQTHADTHVHPTAMGPSGVATPTLGALADVSASHLKAD